MPRLSKEPGLQPEHIIATSSPSLGASLVDPWGRPFRLRRVTRIGRNPNLVDIAILDDAVSMIHADIYWESDSWWLLDLGSTNGTFVEGQRILEATALVDGQRVSFGDVVFTLLLP